MTQFQQNTLQEQLALIESQASPQKGLNLEEKLTEDKLKDNKALRLARMAFQGCLLMLLIFEIFFVSYLIISQGTGKLLFTNMPFLLNEWAFALFINVALVQTCILIRSIAKDLFPGKKSIHASTRD